MKESHEHTTQEKKQHRRFLELASSGLLYIKILRNTIKLVMYARELGNLPEEMRCLYHCS
jgi:hypothetical protein